MSTSESDRVMIFIDGSNLLHSFRTFQPDIRYDVHKLIVVLLRGRRLVRPFFFGSEAVPASPSQTHFYDTLRYSGIDVMVKPLKTSSRTI